MNHLVVKYTKDLVRHATNIYSVSMFFMAAIVLFVNISESLKISLTNILIFTSFIIANFKLYAEKNENSKKRFNIILKNSRISPHAFLGKHGIDQKLSFTLTLEIINQKKEIICLKKPEITNCSFNENIFEFNQTQLRLRNNQRPTQIHFPFNIEPESRETFYCDLGIRLKIKDSIELSKSINDFGTYNVTIEFPFENMSMETESVVLNLKGEYETLKESILNFWKENNQYEQLFNSKTR